MNTILNQPVFLNPQAYYVFPQLYDMTPSLEAFTTATEEAYYTGTLSIDMVYGTIKYKINPNNIEFIGNGECMFTITQTTDIGSCVLGRWRVYGTLQPQGIVPVARYSARSKTNQDTDRDVLKDLTGNGHDISLKNFGYSLMSGYGGYKYNFKSWTNHAMSSSIPCTDSTWIGNGFSDDGGWWLLETIVTNSPSFRIKVSGLIGSAYLTCVYRTEDTSRILILDRNQEYEIPASENNTRPFTLGFLGYFFVENNAIVTIEQIPDYPNGLLLDGIDDCGINDNFPILTDYTVIAKRIILQNTSNGTFLSKWRNFTDNTAGASFGAFIVDRLVNTTNWSTYSFGARTPLATEVIPPTIVVQTARTYNGLAIPRGNYMDSRLLLLGATAVQLTGGSVVDYLKCVMYDVIIYDRTLTPEEIESEIIKYNL